MKTEIRLLFTPGAKICYRMWSKCKMAKHTEAYCTRPRWRCTALALKRCLSDKVRSSTLSVWDNNHHHHQQHHLQTEISTHFHKWQHHCEFSAQLQKLSLSATVCSPLLKTGVYTKVPVLRAEDPQGDGLWLHPNPTPRHTCIHRGYIMAHFPCLPPPMCAFLCFVSVLIRNRGISPLADLCLVLHHYTERRGSTNFWAKPTLLDVHICLHRCGNSSQAASFTLATTHIGKKNTDGTQNKQKGADQSTATCSVCLHV